MSVRATRAAAPKMSAAIGALALAATLGLAGCGDDLTVDDLEQDVEEGVDDVEEGVDDVEEEVDEEVEGEETDG